MTTTTTDIGRPLDALAVTRIAAQHEARVGDGQRLRTSEHLLYTVDGRALGSDLQPEARDSIHRLVSIPASRLPTRDELEAVRVLPNGDVVQPESLESNLAPDDFPTDAPAVAPAAPKPRGPVPWAGPLSSLAIAAITARHNQRIPQHVRTPGLGRDRSAALDMPPEVLLYTPKNGAFVGSAANPALLPEDADPERLVRLRTDQAPDPRLLRAVVVEPDGAVVMPS